MLKAVREDDPRMENFIDSYGPPRKGSPPRGQHTEIKVQVDATHKAFFTKEDGNTDAIKSGYVQRIRKCVVNYNEGIKRDIEKTDDKNTRSEL